MVWQPSPVRQRYRILITLGFGVLLLGIGLFVVQADAGTASADVQVGSLSVDDVNRTVDGGVTDVQIDASLTYGTSAPDPQMRVVELLAGPSESELSVVSFSHSNQPDATGTVDLSGSLVELDSIDAETLTPATGETTTQDIVVGARIEVERANGDTITRTVTQPATIRIENGTDITADLGGEIDLSVQTG